MSNQNETKKSEQGSGLLEDLLYLMARLRDENTGCPWDIKQDFQSLTPSTIEEAYEVVEAIESRNPLKIKEELGDLLFQVVFYAQLGAEADNFDFYDILKGITEKLIRRHPHVFPQGELHGRPASADADIREEQVNKAWENIKAEERRLAGDAGLLDGIAVNLPALTRAGKIQKRAASVGFDWTHTAQVIEKVREELAELELAIQEQTQAQIEEELGDLLFSCVNLSRHLRTDAEGALRLANRKFSQRLCYVEKALAQKGLSIEEATRPQMEQCWNLAKAAIHDADKVQ